MEIASWNLNTIQLLNNPLFIDIPPSKKWFLCSSKHSTSVENLFQGYSRRIIFSEILELFFSFAKKNYGREKWKMENAVEKTNPRYYWSVGIFFGCFSFWNIEYCTRGIYNDFIGSKLIFPMTPSTLITWIENCEWVSINIQVRKRQWTFRIYSWLTSISHFLNFSLY